MNVGNISIKMLLLTKVIIWLFSVNDSTVNFSLIISLFHLLNFNLGGSALSFWDSVLVGCPSM